MLHAKVTAGDHPRSYFDRLIISFQEDLISAAKSPLSGNPRVKRWY